MNNKLKDFAVITPSYINSDERFEYSSKSYTSLYENISPEFAHVVIDDIPRVSSFIPNLKHYGSAGKIYNGKNIILKRRFNQGAFKALEESIQVAKELGAKFVYIHLDDCVYNSLFSVLVESAIEALKMTEKLATVRISDFPLISSLNKFENGNSTFLKSTEEKIEFEKITLEKNKYDTFTLWLSRFGENTISDNFWPITLWGSVYRIEFLEQLLTNTPENYRSRLGGVEKYYFENWDKLNTYFKDLYFGFINMQFGLFEMHRNKNWEELLNLPNNKIL